MTIIRTIIDFIDGIKSLPSCAEAVRELAEFSRESNQAYRDAADSAHDAELNTVKAERDLLQRKLDYLLRPRKQSEEPCPFDEEVWIVYHDGDGIWCSAQAGDLMSNEFWRPVDLRHFEE